MPDRAEPTLSRRLVGPAEAARYLGFTRRALEAWRQRGGGPRYVRVSARAVRYDVADLDVWIAERLRNSTSDAVA